MRAIRQLSAELVAFSEEHKVDMLVMGAHGNRLLGDLLWGGKR